VRAICRTYADAPALHVAGTHVASVDEKTGIQARERLHPTKPTRPGLIERREFEYVRHGTLCLIANFLVATGQSIAPTNGLRRTLPTTSPGPSTPIRTRAGSSCSIS
jgi:hypothetical protein